MRRAHGVAVGGDLGGLAQDGDVDVGDAPAARAHRAQPRPPGTGASAAPFQRADRCRESAGRCRRRRWRRAAHRSARAAPTSASEWPSSACVWGMLHAAQPDVVAGREAMHVEALCRCATRRRRCGQLVGHGQVLRGGELDVALAARDQRHRQPGPFGDGGIVGAWRCRPLRRRRGRRGSRRSGSLAGSAPATGRRAVERGGNAPVGAGLLQRIGHRHGRDGAGRVRRGPSSTRVDDIGA